MLKDQGKKIPYWSFYSLTSGTSTPLCSKLNCEHGDKSECNAVFFDKIDDKRPIGNIYDGTFVSDFAYYGGSLFRLSYNEKDGTRLISYDYSGGDMVVDRVVESDTNYKPLEAMISQKEAFVIYKGYAYIYLKSNDDKGKITHRYIRAKLGSKESYEVLLEYTSSQYASNVNGTNIIADGDYIYMYRPLGSKKMELSNFSIYSYNINTSEVEEIFNSLNDWDASLFIEEPDYPYNTGGNGIFSKDFCVSGNDIYTGLLL